jgi:16S rRNA (uracil1498-N3)-methyltransferase
MDERLPRARFLVESCPARGESIRLTAAEMSHVRARRLSPGETVILVDGSGREARGRLVELSRSGARFAVESVIWKENAAPVIDLLVAGLKLERLSWIAEKATELGASRIILVASARTQSHRAGPAALERLSRVARQAAKQSESARWPAVEGPRAFLDVLGRVDHANRLLLDPGGAPFPARLAGPVSLLVGPEGGWTEAERKAARDREWLATSLPAGKLRAETAAVAALVLARAALANR